jgi:predicted nuclease of predicted toxin-antitoxin system
MKLVVDECTGPAVAHWLEQQGHDVFSVYDQARGLADDRVIEIAQSQERILITNDRGLWRKSLSRTTPTPRRRFSSPC